MSTGKPKELIGKPRPPQSILTEAQMIGSNPVKLLKELMPTLGETPITPQFARATLIGLRKRYGLNP